MLKPKPGFATTAMTRLALGPVLFVLATGALVKPASADPQAEGVYRKVMEAEGRVVKALTAKDGKALASVASGLGPTIEAAMARQQAGQRASACDLAAHSLAFLAVSAAGVFNYSGEARRLLLGDARTAAGNFKTDMSACEGLLGRNAGNHTSAEKALRAL